MTQQVDTLGAYSSLTSTYGSDMTGMVGAAGDYVGVKATNMTSIGMVESGLKADAKNKRSSATGLFQFTGGTWNEMVTKYGDQYGIPKGTKATDPAANSLMAALYIKENNDVYNQQFGEEAGLTETYLGHFLGPTGRKGFMSALKANPNALASDVISAKQARSNPEVFGKGATLQSVYDHFTNKLGGLENKGAAKASPAQNDNSVYDRIGDAALTKQFKTEVQDDASLQQRADESNLLNRTFGANARPTGSSFGDTRRDDMSVVDTEKGLFDGSLDLMSNAYQLTPMGSSLQESAYYLGIKNRDPALEYVREAFYGKEDHSPLRDDKGNYMGQTEPFIMSDELVEKVLSSGLDKKWFPYLQGALTPQDFMQKLNAAHDLSKSEKARSQAGLGAQVVGGLTEAAFDPLTYATLGFGAAANVGRNVGQRVFLAGVEGSAMAVTSEFLVDEATQGGVDTDFLMAATTGFLFGSGLRVGAEGFSSLGNRMKARAESVEAGVDDISKAPAHDPANPGNYVMAPKEPDAVVMGDGTIFTGSHPFNPMRHMDDAAVPQLDKHVDLSIVSRSITEMYITAYKDPNPAVSQMATKLFKADVGLEGGGKRVESGMTAEDVFAMQQQRDYTVFNDLNNQLIEAGAGGRFGMTRGDAKHGQMQLDIIDAIESGDLSRLTSEQTKVVDTLNDFFMRKHDDATNPSKFGNMDAKSVFTTNRDPKGYVPLMYDKGKRLMHVERFGGEDGLKLSMKNNFMSQFDADHKGVKAKAAEAFKEQLDGVDPAMLDKRLRELVEEHAEKTAYGVSNQGKFTFSSAIDDVDASDSLKGFENNNFTEMRNIFDSSFVSHAEDGMPFKVNDLRFTDLKEITEAYARRMNGDIALHATGKTTKEIKDEILAMPKGDGQDALKDAVRIFTGRAREGSEVNTGKMFAKGLNAWTLLDVGQKMWITAAGDAGALVANRTAQLFRGGIPTLSDMLNPTVRHNQKTLNEFGLAMYGTAVNKVFSGTFRGMRESLGEGNKPMADIASGFAYGSRIAAHNSLTKLLTKTTNILTDQARNGVMADVFDAAFNGNMRFSEAALKSADVTPAQFDAIKVAFQKHIKKGKDGQLTIDQKGLLNDPSTNALWRLTDSVATAVTLNPNRVGMMYTKQPNEWMGLVLQFKSFMLKGINGTFMRRLNEAGNGQAGDAALATIMTIGFGMAMHAGNVLYSSIGVDEDKRDEYLNKQLSLSNLAYQGLSRSSITGAPLGMVNMIGSTGAGIAGDQEKKDFFSAGRTTTTSIPYAKREAFASGVRHQRAVGNDLFATAQDNIPAVGTVTAGFSALQSSPDAFFGEYGRERNESRKAFKDSMKRLLPNDPIVQALINEMATNVGVAGKYN